MSETAMQLAKARLDNALKAVVQVASDERARLAYEHGYAAGEEHGRKARDDRETYRRGYSAGYAAGRRGSEAQLDGAATGRPRLSAVGDDRRYDHLSGRDRQEAIRESNQRAGGDLYGG